MMSAPVVLPTIIAGAVGKHIATRKGEYPTAPRYRRAETRASSASSPLDRADTAGDFSQDSADRLATARLEGIAAWWRGTRIFRFSHHWAPGLSGRWFSHRVLGMRTGIAQGFVTQSGTSRGTNSVAAASYFMEASGANVARVSLIGGDEAGQPQEPQYTSGSYRGFYCTLDAVAQSRELLRLGNDSELFLARLGRHTRRNIRRAERIADELGMRFLLRRDAPSFADRDAVYRLASKNKPAPHTVKQLAAYEAHIRKKARRFESSLTLASGEMVSYSRGYIEDGVAYLLYQANDPVVPRINLSLLHRFKLIEQLIAEGVTEVIFPFGCAGLLGNACEVLPIEEWVIIQASPRGIFTAVLLVMCKPRSRMAKAVRHTLGMRFALWAERRSTRGGTPAAVIQMVRRTRLAGRPAVAQRVRSRGAVPGR